MQRRNTGIAMRKATFLRLDQPDSMNVGGRQNSCCRSSMSVPDDILIDVGRVGAALPIAAVRRFRLIGPFTPAGKSKLLLWPTKNLSG